MGNWSISIQGTGCHHNNDPRIDADLATKEFVDRLIAQGHKLQSAHFTSGGAIDLTPSEKKVEGGAQ